MAGLDPEAYEAWFDKPLGRLADRAEKRLIEKYIMTEPSGLLLDGGCGTGHFDAALGGRRASIIGLDSSFEMLEYARSKYCMQNLVHGNVETLPFLLDSFDTVVMLTALELLGAPQSALSEARRVLKPSGRLFVGYLERFSPWGLFRRFRGLVGDSFWRKVHFFSRPEIKSLMTRAGFETIRVQSTLFGSFVLISGRKSR
jgi:ubiquinone/menaquinone biosynthesis C-methylase UbiE